MVASKRSFSVFTTLLLSIASVAQAHGADSRYGRREGNNRRHAAAAFQLARDLAAATPTAPPTGATPTAPPLSFISSGMPSETPLSLFTTFTPGASAPIAGATPLPAVNINTADYPKADATPPTSAPELAGWLEAVKAANIPNNPITHDGDCTSQPDPSANGSCWWTCGSCTRDTDVASCPDKNTWGVSYDDGPSNYTPKLLDYLHATNVTATFFVVGSRAMYLPQVVQAEYMLGHSVSVHTWSHPALTELTNEQIVAELGWTMVIIQRIIGVTPNTFRPPYGDIDDRVRAVAKVMGLTPIMWTGYENNEFDTDDWKVAQGTANATASLSAFETILDLASNLKTGFIVLEHDLYQVTVDMAVGFFLQLAKQRNFLLQPIHQCLHMPLANFYIETAANVSSSPTPGGKSNTTLTHTSTSTGAAGATHSPGAACRSTSSMSGSMTILAAVVVMSLGMMGFGVRLLF